MKKIGALVLAFFFVLIFSSFVNAENINPNAASNNTENGRILQVKIAAAKNTQVLVQKCDYAMNDPSTKSVQAVADGSSTGSGINVSKPVRVKSTNTQSKAAASNASKVSTIKTSSSAPAAKIASNSVRLTEAPQSNGQMFDTSCTGIGLLRINYTSNSGKRIKLSIAKDGTTYIYNLQAKGNAESFSLQMGSGQYKVKILQNTEGSSYQTVESSTIDVNIGNQLKVYLNSIQNVNWNGSMAAIVKARAIAGGMTCNADKINAIYNFVVTNIHYDKNKLSNVTSDYLPSIDSTLRSGTGICYDYSSLFCAMLRSVGVPAKLVKGYTSNAEGYHAWNEVYENGRWVVIDTTYDSQMKSAGYSVNMIKSSSQYSKLKEY